jgi:Ca2+-binding RTX toxin-like protein
MRRRAGFLAAAVATALACVGSAAAAVAATEPQRAVLYGDGLDVFGTDGPDQITVRPAPTGAPQVEFMDPAGLKNKGHICRRVDSTVLFCLIPPLARDVALYGGRGNDYLRAAGRLHLNAYLSADRGNDTVVDGLGKSIQRGGPGADTLQGGPGRDRIYGDRGTDSLSGGFGPDRVHADYGDDDVDLLIDCGPGDDHATLDAIDPIPSGCEAVR